MTILGKLNEAKAEDWDNLTKPFAPLCPPTEDRGHGFRGYLTPSENNALDKIAYKVASTGGSSSYYELPEGASELQDLIEYRKMDFATANVFKAAWRDGKKVGTSSLYDWRKIRWFADRKIAELEQIEQEERKYEEDNGIY